MARSRILVTSRKESVATVLGSSPSQVFHLNQLSDEVCWLILSQMAFVGEDDDELRKSYLEDIGREIAKKCKGLPLAAKTLGGLLRGKKDRNQWQNILNTSRGFFQDFDKFEDGGLMFCKMHDMVHDFVQYLSNNEVVVILDSSSCSSNKAHHLRLMIEKDTTFSLRSVNGIEKLRSLVIFSNNGYIRGNFNYVAEVKQIPKEIGKLIHLRYLNLSGGRFRHLPEEICELKNLLCLNFYRCTLLEELPDGIGKLTNLRSLHTHGCRNLKYYPKGIGRLTSLRELDRVKARVDGNANYPKEFSIGDLENLDLLHGKLEISLVGNVTHREEAKRAKLHKKIHLTELEITAVQAYAMEMEGLIEALNPPLSLKVRSDIVKVHTVSLSNL
ncbi:NB-ARC domain-containing protein [Corchorus olitorius]|uniref:NB-ARC domain-containing protein n=1 Tax=Corchorus olitorius TaxID=93759 RepID=A0A1R3HFJ3_9ROSI|nr:NB-ARC domain-containing protein [Corchorus olitorius]